MSELAETVNALLDKVLENHTPKIKLDGGFSFTYYTLKFDKFSVRIGQYYSYITSDYAYYYSAAKAGWSKEIRFENNIEITGKTKQLLEAHRKGELDYQKSASQKIKDEKDSRDSQALEKLKELLKEYT